MKKLLSTSKRPPRLLGVIFLMLYLFLSTVQGQNVPSLFVVVDFMKVEPENLSEYLRVEQEIWKPLHEERIKEGIIVGWYLYAVEFSGTADEYNYVVINLYDGTDNLENPWNADIPRRVHSDLSVAQIMKQTQEARKTIKSELFYSVATAPAIPLDKPSPYLQVNFMHVEPGKQSEYEQLESEIWLPIHNASIEAGNTSGWGLWRSLFPGGAGRSYQYLTLNTFSLFETVFGLDFSVPFENLHPGKDFGEISRKTQEVRTVMRTELWDLVDFVIR